MYLNIYAAPFEYFSEVLKTWNMAFWQIQKGTSSRNYVEILILACCNSLVINASFAIQQRNNFTAR